MILKKELSVILFILMASVSLCQIPEEINYQAKVEVDGVPYDGAGEFKFAIVDSAGTQTFWSNDGTSVAGSEPSDSVSLTVTGGILNVRLGDTTQMNAISPSVFENQDTWLRIWFDDGENGFQVLGTDQKITSVPYAMMATTVPDKSITGNKLTRESVWPEHEGRSNTVVSFFESINMLNSKKVYTVPAGKNLVLTDIVFGSSHPDSTRSCIKVSYIKDSNETILFGGCNRTVFPGAYEPYSVNFKAGLAVPEGAELYIQGANNLYNWAQWVTISGFVFSY